MNKSRRAKLLHILWITGFCAIAILTMLYALRDNINVYMTPSEVIATKDLKGNQGIQLGGMVAKASFIRGEGVEVKFNITDYINSITVYYSGVLPALFKEGQGVIAIGNTRQDGTFIAKQLLAKHDENYRPPMLRLSAQQKMEQDSAS